MSDSAENSDFKYKIMKTFFYMCFVAVLACCAIGAEIGNLNEFKSILGDSDRILLTCRDQGVRFNYQIGDGERRVSNYGESIEIQNDQSAQFATKGLKVTLTPIIGRPGSFMVDKKLDLRSMGGGLSHRSFTLSVKSGAVIFGGVTNNP